MNSKVAVKARWLYAKTESSLPFPTLTQTTFNMNKILSVLPWVLTATVVVATPIVLFSGYQPKGHDVTLTSVGAEDAKENARRAQEFARKVMKGSMEKSF
jgi:hypothetical protein